MYDLDTVTKDIEAFEKVEIQLDIALLEKQCFLRLYSQVYSDPMQDLHNNGSEFHERVMSYMRSNLIPAVNIEPGEVGYYVYAGNSYNGTFELIAQYTDDETFMAGVVPDVLDNTDVKMRFTYITVIKDKAVFAHNTLKLDS